MSRNPVQFQRGYSLSAFFDEYGTETQCDVGGCVKPRLFGEQVERCSLLDLARSRGESMPGSVGGR